VSDDDRARWNARHAAAGPSGVAPPGVLAGAAELTANVPRSGRALDVACGRGGVAVWLGQRGLAVDAVDVSPVALADGVRLAAAAGVAGRIRWIAHDLDAGLPGDCRGPYDLVVCQLFRDPRRYADLVAALAPGGLLAITVPVGYNTAFDAALRSGEVPLKRAVALRRAGGTRWREVAPSAVWSAPYDFLLYRARGVLFGFIEGPAG
jgi:SAM-dependent methyltransferase